MTTLLSFLALIACIVMAVVGAGIAAYAAIDRDPETTKPVRVAGVLFGAAIAVGAIVLAWNLR